ncbi:hypothetical protein C1645_742592 [Glomus cerebriforme]|uniref:Uncharacterized protein n=1 Tax=Glomus cerebriforme TaxID=658196 RepID=A0A397SHC1_9GLOM|nr:hypothetical protein C1645_742592 [Glomus cerebriforme]
MDTSLNINNGGQQFELQFPPIDPSAYEGPNSYADAGPTRNRRSRLRSTTPYSRNNSNINRSAHADVASITWLRALVSSLLPSFVSKLLGLTGSQSESRRDETSPRLGQKNDSEMDIDQHHEGLNGIQERLVQSNRIFAEQPITGANGLSSRSRRRSETAQNNSIKRKRSETSIEAVEENLRRQAQIEDQNHKPDLKELYYKNIDPNWYKPFKNNPDNYPKFSSSSRVTTDTYGPDQNLNLPKESPPLKKFKPSITPTPRWFDYYPDKVEDIIDKRRTENIVEKRKAEEKTIEKEKALHKSKKGKERATDINLENGEEKSSGTTSTSPIHISPLKDQSYFAIKTRTPVVATSPQMIFPPSGIIETRPPIPSTVVSSSKIDDKRKSTVTTPEKTAQSVKSPSSMESIVYTHENKDDKSSLGQTHVTDSFTNLSAEDKRQSTSIVNNDSSQKDRSQTSTPLVSEPKSDGLATLSIVNKRDDKQMPAPLSIEPHNDIKKEETTKPISLTTTQDIVDDNSGSSLSEANQSLSTPFITPHNNDNNFVPLPLFSNKGTQPPILATPFLNNTMETGKCSTNDEMEKKEKAKTSSSQPQDNLFPNFQLKKNGQDASATIPSFFSSSLTTVNKADSSFDPAFASTVVSTTASIAPSFSFGSTSTGQLFNGIFSNESDNHIGKTDKPYSKNRLNPRNRRNKQRNFGASGLVNKANNQKTAKTDQGTKMMVPIPNSEFEFAMPSPVGSGTSSQQSLSFSGFTNGGSQTQQITSTSAPIFGAPLFGTTSMFGSSQASISDTGFSVTQTQTQTQTPVSMFTNATSGSTAFGFGTNTAISTSIGLSTAVFPTFGSASQNSITATGFGGQISLTPNSIMQNGQPDNLLGQQMGFGSSQPIFPKINQQNFNNANVQEFNSNSAQNLNQNLSFDFGTGRQPDRPDNRPVRKMRRKKIQ